MTAPARLLGRYRADIAASLADDAATFAGSARLVFAVLALIAVAYPLVASGVHATVHSIPRSEADQIILSPFFEDVYVETPLFMLAAVAVGIFSPALGILFILVFAPADLIAAVVAPITELVAPAALDLVLLPIAGRVVSYALLWVLAVEIPILIRAYALVLATRIGRQTSVPMVVATSVASTLVLVFLWARAIPYLIQPVGRWSFNVNVNFIANTAMHDHWWVVVVGAGVAAAIAALWPKPVREDEYLALATPSVPRSAARQLLREIGAVLAVALLLSGLMSTLETAALLIGSLLLTGPVLSRLLPRLPMPSMGPPPRSPVRWAIAMGIVLALGWIALALAPSDITDGYLVAAAVVAAALPLFRILLEAGRSSTQPSRSSTERVLPPPVVTSIVVALALGFLLMLPSAVLANDKSTADELLEFAKGQWDSFLGMMAAALAAGAAMFSSVTRSLGDAFLRGIPIPAQPPGPSEWEQYPSPPPLLSAEPGADPTVWDGEGPPPTPLNEPSGACVLTTACVTALGKDDDCHELRMFRRMRDEYLGNHPQATAVIDAYYETAPRVVAAIEATADAEAAWRRLYAESIAPVVDLLDADRIDEAVALALSRYEAIKQQYGVA